MYFYGARILYKRNGQHMNLYNTRLLLSFYLQLNKVKELAKGGSRCVAIKLLSNTILLDGQTDDPSAQSIKVSDTRAFVSMVQLLRRERLRKVAFAREILSSNDTTTKGMVNDTSLLKH